MERVEITFGRLLKSVGECVLPASLAADVANVDADVEVGSASRRPGFVRALDVQLSGPIKLIAGFDDYTGDSYYHIVDANGVNKES